MRLSVVIVSYNVYPFLDNCLRSVRQALRNIEGEIIVVDNASVDRTPQLVAAHFPDVRLLVNHDNPGFAKANNQGLAISRGDYVLLLNPDTIVAEDTFTTCLDFMDAHPQTGAIGVKMLDGSGRFLPESKRGLPTLTASCMKMTGLYRLAPRSGTWNRYYQGHIGENETAKVEVLCGAFMFLRRRALDEAGGLDEDFFMYGEDIDLSYRITKAGFDIVYLPTTSIIHYKGESTRKSSLNYLLTFYEAMLIFTRKHPEFSGQRHLIRIAIYFHGFLQFTRQQLRRIFPLLMDCLWFGFTFVFVSRLWAREYFRDPEYFKPAFYTINVPLYTGLFLLALMLSGAYDRPMRPGAVWRGFFSGLLVTLAVYALLPAEWRTSRMVILLGSALIAGWLLVSRMLTGGRQARRNDGLRRTIIVAGKSEANRIKELINRSRDQLEVIGTVSMDDPGNPGASDDLGHFTQLQDIVRVHQVREIIFSAQDVPFAEFTKSMTMLGPDLRYMLAASTTLNIVGSMNKDSEGESYAIRVHFTLSHPQARRAKRILDCLAALLLLMSSPLWLALTGFHLRVIGELLRVVAGQLTLVAYHPADPLRATLPPLPNGLLHPGDKVPGDSDQRRLGQIDYVYARDYHWTTDLAIIFSQFDRLTKPALRHA